MKFKIGYRLNAYKHCRLLSDFPVMKARRFTALRIAGLLSFCGDLGLFLTALIIRH